MIQSTRSSARTCVGSMALLNLTSIQTVDTILRMRPGNRLTRRESSVCPLDSAADDRMSYRNRNRRVALARKPLLCTLGNQHVALAARDHIVPLALLTCLQGTGIAGVDLCMCESLPVAQVMLDQQRRHQNRIGIESQHFAEDERRLACPPKRTGFNADIVDIGDRPLQHPTRGTRLLNAQFSQRRVVVPLLPAHAIPCCFAVSH